jgi:hypothetical protein
LAVETDGARRPCHGRQILLASGESSATGITLAMAAGIITAV